MGQPEFQVWTQLKREKSSQLDRVEPSKLTRYHQLGKAVQHEAAAAVMDHQIQLEVHSESAAARQSGPGWNAASSGQGPATQ